MEVSNEYLMDNWIVSINITNFLLVVGHRARIYFVSTSRDSELVDLSSSKVAPKKPAHKSINIHKLTIAACSESHII
jgi:hypothetical protein